MKKLLILFTFVIFSYACMAQAPRIALSKSASLQPPRKMRKAEKQELSSLANTRFSKAKSLSRLIEGLQDKVYLVDDIVVLVNSGNATKEKGLLASLQRASDASGLNSKGYASKIEKIAGKDVFVIDHETEGLKLYRFTLVNPNEDFVVTGFVEYKPGQEVKARKVLEDLVKGFKFD